MTVMVSGKVLSLGKSLVMVFKRYSFVRSGHYLWGILVYLSLMILAMFSLGDSVWNVAIPITFASLMLGPSWTIFALPFLVPFEIVFFFPDPFYHIDRVILWLINAEWGQGMPIIFLGLVPTVEWIWRTLLVLFLGIVPGVLAPRIRRGLIPPLLIPGAMVLSILIQAARWGVSLWTLPSRVLEFIIYLRVDYPPIIWWAFVGVAAWTLPWVSLSLLSIDLPGKPLKERLRTLGITSILTPVISFLTIYYFDIHRRPPGFFYPVEFWRLLFGWPTQILSVVITLIIGLTHLDGHPRVTVPSYGWILATNRTKS